MRESLTASHEEWRPKSTVVCEADGVRLSADTNEQNRRGDEQGNHADVGHGFSLEQGVGGRGSTSWRCLKMSTHDAWADILILLRTWFTGQQLLSRVTCYLGCRNVLSLVYYDDCLDIVEQLIMLVARLESET